MLFRPDGDSSNTYTLLDAFKPLECIRDSGGYSLQGGSFLPGSETTSRERAGQNQSYDRAGIGPVDDIVRCPTWMDHGSICTMLTIPVPDYPAKTAMAGSMGITLPMLPRSFLISVLFPLRPRW